MTTVTRCDKKIGGFYYPSGKPMRKTCETCKHYSESDEDAFMHGTYKAVFRNSCELHEEPMHRFWEQMCEDWEPNEEENK